MSEAVPLVLGVAGGAVGSMFGMPQLGFAAGSLLGSALFPVDSPDQASIGPRLGDLAVTASTYGRAIPLAYGTVKMGGNVIWAQDLIEKENVETQTQGGKGGPSQTSTNTTFSYYANFAVSFCEGPAEDVIRIWADNKLIYDKSGSGALTTKKGLKFRFYAGDETQLPDSLIEADKGEGNVPAHRGLCYIVFDEMPLSDFGNRPPNITAEIAVTSQPAYPSEVYGIDPSTSSDSIFWPYDYVRKKLYHQGGTTAAYLRRISVPALQEEIPVTKESAWSNYSTLDVSGDKFRIALRDVDPHTGYLLGVASSLPSASIPILKIDPLSLKVVKTFPADPTTLHAGADNNTINSFEWPSKMSTVTIGESTYVLVSCIFGRIGILNLADMSYVWGANAGTATEVVPFNLDGSSYAGAGAVSAGIAGKKYATSQDVWWLAMDDADQELTLHGLNITQGAAYNVTAGETMGISFYTDTVFTLSDFKAAGVPDSETLIGGGMPLFSIYDPDTNAILFTKNFVFTGSYVFSIDLDTKTLNWGTQVLTGNFITSQVYSYAPRYTIEESPYYVGYNKKLDKITGEFIAGYDIDDWDLIHSGIIGAYDPDYHALIRKSDSNGASGVIYLDRGTGVGDTLDSIVSDLSQRGDLLASDLDVTDLAGTNVLGYIVTRRSTIRAAIEPLSLAYFFDAVESDYQLKFIDRGGSVAASITQEELGSVSGNDFWIQDKGQEQDMPMRLSVGYQDIDREYEEGTQYTKRAAAPFPTMYSVDDTSIALPIVLTGDEAKQISEKHLYTTWVERDKYETMLSWAYLALDPTDIITVLLDDGAEFKVRITSIGIGADYSLRLRTLEEEVANYTSVATADTEFVASKLTGALVSSIVVVHNVPLLSDNHDQGRLRSVLYVQAGPIASDNNADWGGATVYSSIDKIEWSFAFRSIAGSAYGHVDGILAAPSDVFAVDTASTLIIWPYTGETSLASVTYSQFLSGAYNMMIVGEEVVNFQNVTDNGDGSYTLDTFLRGRRGTDTIADSHIAGERFYMVGNGNTNAVLIPLSNIGSPMYFKAVGSGQTLDEAQTITITPTGEDLKPYAPVNLVRTEDSPSFGDITIDFDRRTRINAGTTGTLPINEDSEEYEVEVFSTSDFTTEIGQYTGLTTNQWVYTSAQQTADGFAGGTLYIRIYQMSAQVGRGKYYEYTVEGIDPPITYLNAEIGSYSISGQVVDLSTTQNSLTADSGTYSVAGVDATLTPEAVHPIFANVEALLLFEGTDGATTTTDSSSNSHTVTLNDAEIDTGVVLEGTSSLLITANNADSGAVIADNAVLEIGSSEFMLEVKIKPTSVSGGQGIIGKWNGTGNQKSYLLWWSGSSLQFYGSSAGSESTLIVTSSGALSAGVEHHVEVNRDASNVVRLFVDGVMQDSATYASSFFNSTDELQIGNYNSGLAASMQGTIDAARITIGDNVHGSNNDFVVPITYPTS